MKITKHVKKISIKRLIHERLSGFREARGYKRIHASDVTKPEYCPREVRLMDVLNVKAKDEFIGTALAITFDHGEENNSMVADRWLRDLAVGDWLCKECGHLHLFTKVPHTCVKCNSRSLVYREVRFTSEKSGVSCGIDLFLDVGRPLLCPVELKTIDRNKFKDPDPKKKGGLKAPLAEHKQRTCLYLRSIAESNNPNKDKIDTNTAVILYRSKGHGVKDTEVGDYDFRDDRISPFKEFIVHRDDTLTDLPVRRAWAVRTSRDLGVIPEGICSVAFCKRATQCHVTAACFSGNHPIGLKWRPEESTPEEEPA